jgi:hypothetical protein
MRKEADMRVDRNRFSLPLRRVWLVLAIAGVALALTPPPAQAAFVWEPIDPDSSWTCGKTSEYPFVDQVFFQACVIKTPLNYTQGVLVVNNRTGRSISALGLSFDRFSGFSCEGRVSNLTKRGCFTSTWRMTSCEHFNHAWGSISVNGRDFRDAFPSRAVQRGGCG